ncbi:MAG: hypothetical protein ACRCR1_06425 [Aeromonas sp.]
MLTSNEMRRCSGCRRNTRHIVVLVPDSNGVEVPPLQRRKEFIKSVISGWTAGSGLTNLAHFTRHAICAECGTKAIDE